MCGAAIAGISSSTFPFRSNPNFLEIDSSIDIRRPPRQNSCRPDRTTTLGAAMKDGLARYGQAFKDRAVARLLPPESAALDDVARDVGIGRDTLERWRRMR